MTTETRRPMTAEQVREIAEAHGLPHAEFCIEQDESQFGRDKLAAVRTEFERIAKADFWTA